MINENTRKSILDMLKIENDFLSGEKISSNLMISRVAVWKNISNLVISGYPITAAKRGYILEKDFDLILPYEFSGSIPYHYFKCTDSTMNYAESRLNENMLVAADSQKNGKGRYDRKWFSEEGGLYFTLFIKNLSLPVQKINFLPLLAAYTMVQSIKNIYNITTEIKWPNDIYFKEKKLAGILINSSCCGSIITEIAAGIGININNKVNFSEGVSLSAIKNTKLKRQLLLNDFCSSFMKDIYSIDINKITNFYDKNSFLKNKHVETIDDQNVKISGIAGNMDDHGGLLIKQKNNIIAPVYSCKNMKIIKKDN